MDNIMDIPHWPSVICSVAIVVIGIAVAKFLGIL